jgi:aspartate/methionine/tyrosine aminotransferase
MPSKLVASLIEAGSIRINQMVYDRRRNGVDVTVLSLGEAFFDIPLFDFSQIDYMKGYHYSDSQGIPPLREKIASYYLTRYGVKMDPDKNVLVSAGSKVILYMATLATINPGDEVLIHEPYWVSYPEQVKLCGGTVRVAPYTARGDELAGYINGKVKLVILNNPNNPAGFVYTNAELKKIYELCLKNDATLMIDEAYSDFCIQEKFTSAGKVAPGFKNLIVVNSLSKNFGMSGWRIGYAITSPELMYPLLKLNQHLITCAPTVLQQYCVKYFDEILKHTTPQIQDVVKKRARIEQYMRSIGLSFLEGASTFYFFVKISEAGVSSLEFAEWLLRTHNIAVVPGSAYGVGTDAFVRVGIGAESEERICQALLQIRYACDVPLTVRKAA